MKTSMIPKISEAAEHASEEEDAGVERMTSEVP